MKPIYLDYNATTPILPEVAEAMKPYLYEHFGNPSSSHPYGVTTKRAIENARSQVADLVGCDPSEVIFTSGGTESNNIAIKGVAYAYLNKGNHIITSAVEHPAVMQVCRWLATKGFRVTILPVDKFGQIDPADLENAITPETILVTVMHANNEVGTLEPISRLAEVAHEHGAIVHSDTAQSVGKIPVTMDALGVDLLSIAGHKLYAPKGIGALCVRDDVRVAKILHGADHESGRRPGTENVLEIVGLGRACELAGERMKDDMQHVMEMRDKLHDGLFDELGDQAVRLNGHPVRRLPNTLSVSFRSVEANALLSEIGDRVAASAGAACHADDVEVSPVLEAMQVPVEWAMGTVRFSTGHGTTAEEIDRAVDVVTKAVRRLQPSAEPVSASTDVEEGEYKLTHYTHGLGCACKLRPQELEKILAALPTPSDPALMVGTDTADDAAVYRLSDELAVVQTVDFFTPIVDAPYMFGAISAANSLSDIYAMGARPLFALNVVGFPSNRLPMSVLEKILKGALDKAAEAGVSVIGGHTVDDTEPKFGLAVTGIVHPDRLVRNDTAQPGDALVLTKPVGVGIISTAMKRGLADEDAAREAADLMATLNHIAAEVMNEVGVNACTDITGFGLLGHLREMAEGSGVDMEISAGAVPILEAARKFAGADVVPGGTLNNLAYVEPHVTFAKGVSRVMQLILADAQTSGGLLVSVPADRTEKFLKALRKAGVENASKIGEVVKKGKGFIRVVE
ncbi:MAG: selenide, water dikinase SelD [Candidatus Latescibacteria bacterium]|nr:selenide, water dikinase SelD [Candidatus Latescibacterota bacterium]NIO57235.1 selenide, water dikinase SelD [Candidatus Latescibacterota bacterium]